MYKGCSNYYTILSTDRKRQEIPLLVRDVVDETLVVAENAPISATNNVASATFHTDKGFFKGLLPVYNALLKIRDVTNAKLDMVNFSLITAENTKIQSHSPKVYPPQSFVFVTSFYLRKKKLFF